MARSVSLSDEAFAVLRRAKLPQESDSDVVLRLQRCAARRERDPWRFFRHPPEADLSPAQYEEMDTRMRQADAER